MSARGQSHEEARVKALRAYHVLDSTPEPTLDDLTWLAAHVCEAPMAAITFTDETRTWPKSILGLPAIEVPRGASLCAYTIHQRELFIVHDAATDDRFTKNPLVTSSVNVRFYAGAPLITPDDHAVGALCVLDQAPRTLREDQKEALAAIARQVVAQLELRKGIEELNHAARAKTRAESLFAESDALLRSFYEGAPMMMGIVELRESSFVHVSANPAVASYLECDPDAPDATSANPLPGKEAEEWFRRFLEAHRRKAPLSFEMQHESRLGPRWLSGVVSPLPAAPGGRPRLSYLVEDITSRKRVLEDLRLSEERLALALDSAQEGLWDWDLRTGEFYVSDRWSRMQGYEPSELPPRSSFVLSLLHPEDLPRVEKQVREHIDGRRPFFEVETRTRRKDGSWAWTLTVGKIVKRDANGEPLRMTGTRRDISERKRLDVALAAARDKALEASLAKSAFLANMSHELRTPLNAILGYSEMLDEEAEALGSKESREDLARLQKAAKHLLGLINDILDLSKIESGKMILRPETFEIADIVGDVVTTVRPLIEKNANRLETRFYPALGKMRSDPTRLRQCLLNLLGNAAKFTHGGVVSLAIERRKDDGDEWILFEVADTGVGIAQEQMKHLFQDFSQASATTERRYGGTGLGLSITRRLCRLMGGDVEVKSELGNGSIFTIRLPSAMLAPTESALPA